MNVSTVNTQASPTSVTPDRRDERAREGAALRVLVCDDEELIRWSVAEHLRAEGYEVSVVADGQECLDAIAMGTPDALVVDLKMPRVDGMGVLRRLRDLEIEVPTIVITAHGAVDSAIEATRLGAAGYLSKPFDLRELSLQLKRGLDATRLQREVRYLRQKRGYERLVGESSAMQRVFEMLERLEKVDAPTVLITGESGTGKDLVAQAIHARGPRRDKPYMEIDCAAMPETLIESELFGHEKGAFTDARQQKRGLFEVARGGVIFLDEIGEMTLATQAKLLRALENRKFKRVGGVIDLPLDAAIIAASNRNLRDEVKNGRFREDLFFRLNVVPIETPALRKRAEDVEPLAAHLLERAAHDLGRPVPKMAGDALAALTRYPWPGNVRELRNVLERVVILKQGDAPIRVEDLPPEIRFTAADQSSGGGTESCPFELPVDGVDLEAVEKGLLAQALARCNGNQSAAARLLCISRYALRYRMEKFKLG
ncbi:MAG: sigma-54-dependent Fis family transcriptional regulator [Deltaproteobacteria bacterium]|nr:sigma-54-dependent Fis family transcriptional regulator [Deltaproteobacteria bacterium]